MLGMNISFIAINFLSVLLSKENAIRSFPKHKNILAGTVLNHSFLDLRVQAYLPESVLEPFNFEINYNKKLFDETVIIILFDASTWNTYNPASIFSFPMN